MSSLSLPEFIHQWCKTNYPVEEVLQRFDDLIDVATGNRQGNRDEVALVQRLMQQRSMINISPPHNISYEFY